MITWVLVFYVSSGFGSASTGGPAVVDGFTSKDKCLEFVEKQLKPALGTKLDGAYCLVANK